MAFLKLVLHRVQIFPLYFRPSPLSHKLDFLPSFICRSQFVFYFIEEKPYRQDGPQLVLPKMLWLILLLLHKWLYSTPPSPRWSTPPCPETVNLVMWPTLTKRVWAEMTRHGSQKRLWVTMSLCSNFLLLPSSKNTPKYLLIIKIRDTWRKLKTEPNEAQPSHRLTSEKWMFIGISHWDFRVGCYTDYPRITWLIEIDLHMLIFIILLFFPVTMKNCLFSYPLAILPLDFASHLLRNLNNQMSLFSLASSELDPCHNFKPNQLLLAFIRL